MRCLVFVAKTTGFDCLKWLLDNHPEDEYTIFVSDPDKDEICAYLKSRNVAHHNISEVQNIILSQNANKYDWLINIWSPYIFREDILSKVGDSVNLHPSYLPYGRGRDPVVWAIRDQSPAGATLHRITDGIDAGPIWAQSNVPYDFPTTGLSLYGRVERECVKLFTDKWAEIIGGEITPTEQLHPDLPTRKRKDLWPDGTLDMKDQSTRDIITRLLAHDFSDNGYTATLLDGDKSYAITLQISPKGTIDVPPSKIR